MKKLLAILLGACLLLGVMTGCGGGCRYRPEGIGHHLAGLRGAGEPVRRYCRFG